MEFLFQILVVFLLVFLNGFFVAAEFALVGVRKTRIDELVQKGNRAAKLVQKALESLDSYISATQLGITLASLALGWIGEPAVAHFLEPFLGFLPPNAAFITSHGLAVTIAFSLITILHIVLGELAPKTIALQRAEKVAMFIIVPIFAFASVFQPFIWLLNFAGNLVVNLIGLEPPTGRQLVHSEEEIKMILSQSEESGVIDKDEAEMVINVFKLGDTTAREIMVPRTDVMAFSAATSLTEIEKKIRKNIHSRFPIYEHSIDHVIGFVHIKDIYQEILKSEGGVRSLDKKLSQTSLVRSIIAVSETKKVDELMLEMRRKRIHMAIVMDEFGGTAGLITLENVLESVVGEIEDEFEKPMREIQKQSDGRFLIDGLTPIVNIQERFDLPVKGQGYTTIGGLILGLLGHEPRIGDQVQLGNFGFIIEQVEGKRIKTISLKKAVKRKRK